MHNTFDQWYWLKSWEWSVSCVSHLHFYVSLHPWDVDGVGLPVGQVPLVNINTEGFSETTQVVPQLQGTWVKQDETKRSQLSRTQPHCSLPGCRMPEWVRVVRQFCILTSLTSTAHSSATALKAAGRNTTSFGLLLRPAR